jgi:tRNA pseudouridine38-40 synthase
MYGLMAQWKLTLEYDGTRYSGWQEQKNSKTITGELREAAEKVLGGAVTLDGAGRTDAGVHALAQVARLQCDRMMNSEKLRRAMNQELPKDIQVLRMEEIRGRFHPRKDAIARYYLYQISLRRTAFANKYVWWIRDPLDLDDMREAAGFLVGRHDFERFCDHRGDETSMIVVVDHVALAPDGDLILFRIGASHFLWRMVRRIVGTLAEVGLGHLTPDDFHALIRSSALPVHLQQYSVAAHTAPAAGLFLERVIYDPDEEPADLAAAVPVRQI